MKTDIAIFKLFFNKSVFERCIEYVRVDLLERELQQILEGLKTYYKKFNHDVVEIPAFQTWFYLTFLSNVSEKQAEVFNFIFKRLSKATDEVSVDYVHKLFETQTSKQICDLLDNGKFDSDKIRTYLDSLDDLLNKTEEVTEWIDNDLEQIEESVDRKSGLSWRLNCLNEAIGPLLPGDFGIVAAYVDVGKTAACVSEAVHMAGQLKDDQCVLWLNNEEYNMRVLQKIWKSTLQSSWDRIMNNPESAKQCFIKKMNGDKNRIRLVDIRNYSLAGIKQIVKKLKPSLIIVDQIDKINSVVEKRWKEHDRLKALYGEFRSIANEYCPVLAISQADSSASQIDKYGDVVYKKYLDMRQLDGSKVGKQGEADFIITIGKDLDLPNSRFINIPKNKIGPKQNAKYEVYFDGDKAIYKD